LLMFMYRICSMKSKTKKRIRTISVVSIIALLLVAVLVYVPRDTHDDVSNSVTERQSEGPLLTFPELELGVELGTDGVVSAVERSGDAPNEMVIITLQTEVNSVYTVAVPADHAIACAAGDAIADVSMISIGDKIAVRGKTDAGGRVVPCESEFHTLRIRGVYENSDVGLTFNYKKSPNGYLLMTDGYDFSTSTQFVTGALLIDATAESDRPPVTMLRVYKNPDGATPIAWAESNQSETLIHRTLAEPALIAVGREDAIGFTLRGPYLMDVYVVAFGEYVLVINGEYEEYDSESFRDIDDLVRTIVFTK
jgi:hypothetical protein